ncbi:MAG: hypothetical protein AAGF01_24145 [Cyanobacteria bacterium P01_G01_bin.38]
MIDLPQHVSKQHPKLQHRFLRLLFHPLTWASVGLHVLLLLMPTWELKHSEAEESEILEEEPVIEVESLAELLGQPDETPPSEVPVEPPPQTQAPVPPQQQVLTEVPEELPDELPLDEVPPDEVPPDEPPPDEPPPFDPAVQAQFKSALSNYLSVGASNAAGTSSNFDNTDQWPVPAGWIPRSFSDPAAFFAADSIVDESFQPYPGVEFKYIGRNFDLVSSEGLGPAVQENGLSFEKIDTYGGSDLYVVISPEGNPMNYISLVDMKGSTAVFVWPDDPRLGVSGV